MSAERDTRPLEKPLKPYVDRSRGLVSNYNPIPLSCDMNDYGYWVVVWSAAPGYRLAVTCARVGISRSEAVQDSAVTLRIPSATLRRHGK